jgi:putative SOS response-associated peptidase YedK
MCGRYSITTPLEAMRGLFDFEGTPNLRPRYNVAPSQDVPIVRIGEGGKGREIAQVRWGLVPGWAKDLSISAKLINARAESVAGKPSFRAAFKRRRCLVPADGFYEWRREGAAKQPYRIARPDGAAFAFAGLWESWRAPEGETIESCTILTTQANATLAPIHGRMPVVLEAGAHAPWLDAAAEAEALHALLVPAPDALLTAYKVSPRVNNVRNDDEACLAPVDDDDDPAPEQGSLF